MSFVHSKEKINNLKVIPWRTRKYYMLFHEESSYISATSFTILV